MAAPEVHHTPRMIPVGDLSPNPWNPNRQSDFMQEKERKSIVQFGFVVPIIIRETPEGLQIVDGEHRWRAAQDLGMEKIPANNLGEISDEVAMTLTLALNEIKGQPDQDLLFDLVAVLVEREADLSALPWREEEIALMSKHADLDMSQEPVKEKTPRTLTCPDCGHEWEV